MSQTIYISSALSQKYPHFAKRFVTALEEHGETVRVLPHSHMNEWCRDYMPVRTAKGNWVKFRYAPSYLKSKAERSTIPAQRAILSALELTYQSSELIVDGGAVQVLDATAFISNQVLHDNPDIPKRQLKNQLALSLEVDKVIFLPRMPGDFTGHVDGVFRPLSGSLGIINNFLTPNWERVLKRDDKLVEWYHLLVNILLDQNIKVYPIANDSHYNTNDESAEGFYINYLETERHIYLPVFTDRKSDFARETISKAFPDKAIVPVLSDDPAKEGGVLNCLTWEM